MYGFITYIRNVLFDKGILKTQHHNIPILSVGNLKAGGTGKTPFVEYLLRTFSSSFNIAVVSRGYGRKTKGFFVVNPEGSAETFGDEPLQMARKFPEVMFVVCEDRNHAIKEIEKRNQESAERNQDSAERNKEINLILLDDAFQHRYTARDIDILLTEYNRPFFADKVIPFGLLREYRRGYKRADYIVVTKCPPLGFEDKKRFVEKLKPRIGQRIFFSNIVYKAPYRIGNKSETIELENRSVVLFTGISNNAHIRKYIEERSTLIQTLTFDDHHSFNSKDRERILERYNKVRKPDSILLTTEKDASKLDDFHPDLYVLPIEIEVSLFSQSNETIQTKIQEDLCTIKSTRQQNT